MSSSLARLACVLLLLGQATNSQESEETPTWAQSSWMIQRALGPILAFTDANVVHVESGQVLLGAHIVTQGDRILSVGHADPPEEARIVDLQGKWVIPGLMDLHAHVIPKTELYPKAPLPEESLRQLLKHGVTTIRCLPLVSEEAHHWSSGIQIERLKGPTMVVTSPIFQRLPGRGSLGFETAERARAWVQREALLGSRWIKVYNSMDAKSLEVIVETAHSHGMRVCGHTEEVPPLEASILGMDCIEHVVSIPLSCMSEPPSPSHSLVSMTAARWEVYDPQAGSELLKAFASNQTAWVPTLVVSEQILISGSHDGSKKESAEVLRSFGEGLQKAARLAVQFHRMGGLLGVGTDFPVDGVVPGQSVHRELELLVDLGGATPHEALQMGTINSAKILGFEDLLGSLRPGALADFVVLRNNPLKDIKALGEIELVVHQGMPVEWD